MSDQGSRASVIVRNPNFGQREQPFNSSPPPAQNARLVTILRTPVVFTTRTPIIVKQEKTVSPRLSPVSKPVESPGTSFELHTQTPKKR